MQGIGSSILSGLLFIVVFGSILFVAYVTTKLVAQKTNKNMRGKLVNVVETISLGFDKHLHLIKVGEEFVLISTSGKNIQFMTTLKNNEAFENIRIDERSDFDFKSIIEKYMQNLKTIKKNSVKEKKEGEKFSSSLFKDSLNKLKDITSTKDNDYIE